MYKCILLCTNVYVQGQAENDDEGGCTSVFAGLLTFASMILILLTFPLSVWMCVKMVQVKLGVHYFL